MFAFQQDVGSGSMHLHSVLRSNACSYSANESYHRERSEQHSIACKHQRVLCDAVSGYLNLLIPNAANMICRSVKKLLMVVLRE